MKVNYLEIIVLIEERGSGPLLNLTQTMGGWPPVDDNWVEGYVNIATLVKQIMFYGQDTLYSIYTKADDRDSNKFTIYV